MADHDANAATATTRGLLSLRTILESLIVAGILWLGNSIQSQNTAIVKLQVQIAQVQSSLADVPRMTHDLAQLQTQVAEHERRIGRNEDRLAGQGVHP